MSKSRKVGHLVRSPILARQWGVCLKTINNMARAGILPVYAINARLRLFDLDECNEILTTYRVHKKH